MSLTTLWDVLRRPGLVFSALGLAVVLTSCGAPTRSTTERLTELGAEPCPESEFVCVTQTVPLDQFDPDGRTIDVSFAVLPAEGKPEGVFVTIVGGPGGSGLNEADWQAARFPESIRSRFDLVFFDQRGVGMFDDPACPEADDAEADALGDDPAWDLRVEVTKTYVEDCVAEFGNPEVLAYLGTDQAIQDLEMFRQTMGYERMILYGESYGTSFAQAYATEVPDAVERVVLDGTIDRTRDGLEGTEDQIAGFADTLKQVFNACDLDSTCNSDMGIPASEAYSALLDRLQDQPAVVRFPVEPDVWEAWTITADDMAYLAIANIHFESDRMLFLRALAAATSRNDLVPLARLGYADNDDISSVVLTSVDCLDMSLPGGNSTAEVEAIADARAKAAVSARWGYGFPLACTFWPGFDHARPVADPFTAEGIPILVIASTADAATPYGDGAAVAAQAENGHLLTVEGGSHVMFGRGVACVDDAVAAFVLDGALPEESSCRARAVDDYVPLVRVHEDPSDLMSGLLNEVLSFPEVVYWDGLDDLEIPCTFGGSISFNSYTHSFAIRQCGFTEDVVVMGSGELDFERKLSYLDALSITGDDCAYRYRHEWDTGAEEVTERCP